MLALGKKSSGELYTKRHKLGDVWQRCCFSLSSYADLRVSLCVSSPLSQRAKKTWEISRSITTDGGGNQRALSLGQILPLYGNTQTEGGGNCVICGEAASLVIPLDAHTSISISRSDDHHDWIDNEKDDGRWSYCRCFLARSLTNETWEGRTIAFTARYSLLRSVVARIW